MQTVALPPSPAVTMVKLPEDPGHKQLVIAAIGEAGEGKSTLLNLLLNAPGDQETFFAVSDEPEACTLVPRFRWLIMDPGYSVFISRCYLSRCVLLQHNTQPLLNKY